MFSFYSRSARPRQVFPDYTGACASRPSLALAFAPASRPYPLRAQRLPTTVTPDHYDLAFVVDLARERFEGTETIRVNVAEPTAPHRAARRRASNSVEVTIGAGAAAQTATVALDERAQTATLTVAEAARRRADRDPHPLRRHPEQPAARLLHQQDQAPEVRRHAVRGDRRAPGVSLLRRAGVQGHLRRHADHRSRRHRDLERQGRCRTRRARRRRSTR